MMKLSMMRDFLESESHDTLVLTLLDKWGYDKDSVQFIRASSNFVYTFQRNGEKYILRISPNKSIEKLQKEIDFLNYLLNQGINVNQPIESNKGNIIEVINDKLGTFHCVAFSFLSGNQYDVEEVSEEGLKLWGKALGNLHHHSLNYLTYKNEKVNDCLELINEMKGIIPEFKKSALNELETINKWVETLEVNQENFGSIHFDFELDNLIWNSSQVQIIDFESSIDCWFAADIAFALRDLINTSTEVDLSNKSIQLFLEGYKDNKKLSNHDLTSIPMFIRFHNLYTYTKLLQTIDIYNTEDQPEWIRGLLIKLNEKVASYRERFETY